MTHKVFAPFGPLIYRADVRGEFLSFLLEHLNVMRDGVDAKHTLAGNIESQKFALYPEKEFVSFINPHILNYLQEIYLRVKEIYSNTFSKQKLINPKNLDVRYDLMQGPWINFSKKGEFNPMHNHSGKISAVIFIDAPHELEIERDESPYSMKSSSCLEFVFGNQHTIINPKTGMMYLFPSYLWHLVYPFNTDVERISMSFNIDNLFLNNKRIEMDYDVDWLVEE
tara:strand:- start:185 stop:859 length:675 start_codon:yes stop_codon:yes gene_type:complete